MRCRMVLKLTLITHLKEDLGRYRALAALPLLAALRLMLLFRCLARRHYAVADTPTVL